MERSPETMSSGSNALIKEPCSLVLDQSQLEGLRFTGRWWVLHPSQISYREGFAVEAWWLASPTRLERLVRRYDQASLALLAASAVGTQRPESPRWHVIQSINTRIQSLSCSGQCFQLQVDRWHNEQREHG